MRTRRVLAAVVAIACVAPAAAQALPPRPHTTVATYLRDGVRVTRLQMAVRRTGHRLRAHVSLRVHATTSTTRYLRVGRCTGGPSVAFPTCPAAATIAVHVPANATVRVDRTFTLRQPPPRIDAVLAELGGASPAHRGVRDANARLLLRGGAWRGTGAGRTYGAQIDSDRVERLQFDLAATDADSARLSLVWRGPDAPRGATTTLLHCAAACTTTTLRPERGRSGPQLFATRPDTALAPRVGFTVTSAGQQQAAALLPSPR